MKRLLLGFMLVLVLIFSGCSMESSSAKEVYPSHPVEVVVPFGEGSASDTFARKYSDLLSKTSGHQFQPINKDGSGGLLGMLHAYKQDSDGYTVLEITPSHVIADVLGRGKDIKILEDFEPIAHIQSDIYVLSVAKNSDIKSYDDLIKKGKKSGLTFAGVSPGGLDDLTINAFAKKAGIKTRFIPYPSGAAVKAAALGGEVDIYLDKIVNVVSYIKSDKVRPIVVFHEDRIEQIDELKDVPTTVENGIDMTIGSWRGFVIKKGAPDDVKEYLTKQMEAAFETDEYKQFAKENLVNIGEEYLGPGEFTEKLRKEYEEFDEISKEIGLK
ncbi:MAG TPA: tripartite tricarboxylate transporter substrate binding protein [Candidatus Avamphibacillus sp.]|nr:tripartite tricarboxylate transporter substrate binding protein [Candidatus Avamphibacillus sp.]